MVILSYSCPSGIGIGVSAPGISLQGCVAWENATTGGTYMGTQNSCSCIGSPTGCQWIVAITVIQ